MSPKVGIDDFLVSKGLDIEALNSLTTIPLSHRSLKKQLQWARKRRNRLAADRVGVSADKIHETDLGNARRLVARHGENLRYCHAWRKWLVWDEWKWKIDNSGIVIRWSKETILRIYNEAASEKEDDDKRRRLVQHALRSEAEKCIRTMVELAKSEPGIVASPDELDSDPFLLNVQNGTIDLRTGSLRPHQREDLITRLAAVEYDPDAQCPFWESILDRILDGSQDLIGLLKRFTGYSLTGDTSERKIVILYGRGKNGKTTFIEAIVRIIGDLALRIPTDSLLVRGGSHIPNDLARLRGARFVYACEAEQGRYLAEAKIEEWTGGDHVTARHLYGEWFDFNPEFKLWIATNHKPIIRGTDDAVWDRIVLIPFNIRIPENEEIPKRELMCWLREESSGILRWAVEGCLEWQREGLNVPKDVREATNSYRSEMDSLIGFLTAYCVQKPGVRAQATTLYQAYQAWCEEHDQVPMCQKDFGTSLRERGFQREKSHGTYYWHGIGLAAAKGTAPEHAGHLSGELLALTEEAAGSVAEDTAQTGSPSKGNGHAEWGEGSL